MCLSVFVELGKCILNIVALYYFSRLPLTVDLLVVLENVLGNTRESIGVEVGEDVTICDVELAFKCLGVGERHLDNWLFLCYGGIKRRQFVGSVGMFLPGGTSFGLPSFFFQFDVVRV